MVQMAFRGFLCLHRLLRICTSNQKHVNLRGTLESWTKSICETRTFSTGCVTCCNEGKDFDSKLTPRDKDRRRRRPLSPLERVSGLLSPFDLTPEVMQLREQRQRAEDTANKSQPNGPLSTNETTHKDNDMCNHGTSAGIVEPNISDTGTSGPLPGENLLSFGEVLIAEYYKKRQVRFRKMFLLQKGSLLHSNWGFIRHNNMVEQPAGQVLKTSLGVPILIRRASLEDYVLYMERRPAIVYPKDAAFMLMMMDVSEGDCVLESGSGSGPCPCFCPEQGSVLSVEAREDHLKRAMFNYNRWRTSWNIRQRAEWPNNVHFHKADLCTASSVLAGRGFNSIALDLINPHLALPTVLPHLHHGAVCAVYLANITQVIDLLDGIRCLTLPLLCERIVAVPLEQWLVAPAMQKDGQYCTRTAPTLDKDDSADEEDMDNIDTEELSTRGPAAFGSIAYIARPHPEQVSHSAFLVKLRKCVQ